jgi:hypothetical protein
MKRGKLGKANGKPKTYIAGQSENRKSQIKKSLKGISGIYCRTIGT